MYPIEPQPYTQMYTAIPKKKKKKDPFGLCALLLGGCIVLLLVGVSFIGEKLLTTTQKPLVLPSPTAMSQSTVIIEPPRVVVTTIIITPTPTVSQPTPTATPTQIPTPLATGVNGNPWGYDFVPGVVIVDPPSTFCTYFTCSSTFLTEATGYVVQCHDGSYVHTGGTPIACADDDGIAQILYRHQK